MSRKSKFGKDLTNITKGGNGTGSSEKDKEDPKNEGKHVLKKDDIICPICHEVIVEPVTFPCNHNVCRPCFDVHIWETSINCPCCRRRLSVWGRQAAKENTIVNLKLQKEIKNQFPRQFEAQKQNLQLPPDQRKLDPLLVEFCADDSRRVPPRQFAKTGEIAREFNEMLSKHLQDLHQTEESASEVFISKFVTPEERKVIQHLEKNLKLGEGLKERNGQYLGHGGGNSIELRARTVQVPNLKFSPDIAKEIKSKQEAALEDPRTSPAPSVSRVVLVPTNNQAGAVPAQVFQHQAEAFSTPCDPVDRADQYTTKRGHLGSLYQVLEDHNYFKPLVSIEERTKVEEQDFQLAIELQKDTEAQRVYNLRQRNPKLS